MDTDKLNRWLTLGANLAVLFSIVFLAVEIRQNTEMTRAQITQSRAETSIALAASFYNSDYLPTIWEKVRNDDGLSADERARYEFWLRAMLRNLDNNFQQSRRGLLGDHITEASATAITNAILAYPAAIEYWDKNRNLFSEDFVRFVDQALADASARD